MAALASWGSLFVENRKAKRQKKIEVKLGEKVDGII